MILKTIHISFAVLTVISFTFRGALMLRGSELLQRKWVRVFPHIIDSALFLTGISLAIIVYGAFYKQAWLIAKLSAIVVYILLGSVALKYGRTKSIRSFALLASFLILIYIFSVAVTKSVLPLG